MSETSVLPYRPNVCVLLFDRAYRLFVGERLGFPGAWQLPQGGIESAGTEVESVVREIEEETGIRPELVEPVRRLESVNTYDFDQTPTYAAGRFRGQTQRFWLVRFLGSDSDVDLTRDEHPEFGAWRWARVEELPDLVAPRRYDGYGGALEEFRRFVRGETGAAGDVPGTGTGPARPGGGSTGQ